MAASSQRARSSQGFTLLEVIIAIAVMAVLLAALVPLIVRASNAPREDDTRQKLRALGYAISGNPDTGSPGFLATMGRLPANLGELTTQGALPAATAGQNGVPIGWAGPYVTLPTPFPLQDGWNTALALDTNGTGGWRLRSAGVDLTLNTGDDFVAPPVYQRSTGTVRVELLKDTGVGPSNIDSNNIASVQLFVPVNGVETAFAGNLVTAPNVYEFLNAGVERQVPLGMHAVKVTFNATGPCPSCVMFRNVYVSAATNLVPVELAYNMSLSSKGVCTGIATGPWVVGSRASEAVLTVNAAVCGFTVTPVWTWSLQGASPVSNGANPLDGVQGQGSVVDPSPTGFTVYLEALDKTVSFNAFVANANGWTVAWAGNPL